MLGIEPKDQRPINSHQKEIGGRNFGLEPSLARIWSGEIRDLEPLGIGKSKQICF